MVYVFLMMFYVCCDCVWVVFIVYRFVYDILWYFMLFMIFGIDYILCYSCFYVFLCGSWCFMIFYLIYFCISLQINKALWGDKYRERNRNARKQASKKTQKLLILAERSSKKRPGHLGFLVALRHALRERHAGSSAVT